MPPMSPGPFWIARSNGAGKSSTVFTIFSRARSDRVDLSRARFVVFDELIRPDRVHGSLYTDPDIFAQELERIWYRT